MIAYIVIICVAICLSGFFASAETAYTALPRHRLERMAEDGKGRAKIALKIRNRYDETLCSILACNDLLNVLISSAMTALALLLLAKGYLTGAQAKVFPSLLATLLVLVFGDILPKLFAKLHPLGYALLIAYPLYVVTLILYPLSHPISLLLQHIKEKSGLSEAPALTGEELSAMFETAEEEGVVDEDQSELLQSAMDYRETAVEKIITPRINLVAIDVNEAPEEVRRICEESIYSRLPVYEDTVDNIVGTLSVNRYMRQAVVDLGEPPSVKELMRAPYFVHKSARLPDVLSEMRRRRTHIAVVMDEYGGTMGIATMEDILEEIVGEIWDESDSIVEDDIVVSGESGYVVDGMTPIADFFQEADIDDRDFESEYTTMGGWAIEMLEQTPGVGDQFTYKNLTVTVLEVSDNLVGSLRIEVEEEDE